MELELSDSEKRFRAEVRQFLDEKLTPELRRAGRYMTSVFADYDATMQWHRILYEKGWVAPTWPKEHGGAGWNPMERNIFQEECRLAEAPSLLPMGLLMLGPILIRYGSEEQKRELLPRLLSGDDVWCQGYSEPNAGSDLASLKTSAVREGDQYVVNGSKIWTSYAHRANKIFCLVRTSATGKPQQGISFLLIDLDSPGVTVSPIVGIDGEVEQCQVFFEDARVPVGNLVGEENQGWEVAKYLLEFERGGLSYYIPIKKQLRDVRAVAAIQPGPCSDTYLSDPHFSRQLSLLEIEHAALEALEMRIQSQLESGQNPGALSSLTKVLGTELSQQVDELALALRGPYNAVLQNEVLAPDFRGEVIGSQAGLAMTNAYLNNRASTIYGGTVQIQRNIVAKLVLGL